MYLFLFVVTFITLILLIFFTVVIGLKACLFLDGLAKKAELEEYEAGISFGTEIFQKPNRKKVRASIRDKLRKRMERFGK